MVTETRHRLGEGLNSLEGNLVLVRFCFVVIMFSLGKSP